MLFHSFEVFYSALHLNVNELVKGAVKIRIIYSEYAVTIDNDAGLFMQCFGNRAAKTIGAGAHLAGNNRDATDISFVWTVFMAVSPVFTARDIAIHG